MTPPSVDQEWFKEYLDEKFKHFDTKITSVEKTCESILEQATKTNGRVDKLESWRATSQGTWSAINKSAIIGGTFLGILLNIIWDWFKAIKLR